MKRPLLHSLILIGILLTLSLEAIQYPVPMMKKARRARAMKKAKPVVLPLQISFEKVEEVHGVPMTVPCYKVLTINGRGDCCYHLISQDLAGKYTDGGVFTINEKGELTKPDEEGSYVAILQGYQPAERVKYYLVSDDKLQQAETYLVPWPIEKENAFGYFIRAELLSPSYLSFGIFASGYQPGEALKVKTYVEGKILESKANANRRGIFNYLLLPGARSKEEGGQVTIAIEGQNSSNSIKLPWGTEFRRKGEEFIKRKDAEYTELKQQLIQKQHLISRSYFQSLSSD